MNSNCVSLNYCNESISVCWLTRVSWRGGAELVTWIDRRSQSLNRIDIVSFVWCDLRACVWVELHCVSIEWLVLALPSCATHERVRYIRGCAIHAGARYAWVSLYARVSLYAWVWYMRGWHWCSELVNCAVKLIHKSCLTSVKVVFITNTLDMKRDENYYVLNNCTTHDRYDVLLQAVNCVGYTNRYDVLLQAINCVGYTRRLYS